MSWPLPFQLVGITFFFALHIADADWLQDLTNEDLKAIEMDDTNKFGLVKTIGEAMVEYIMQNNQFTRDLNDTPTRRDELVTAFGDVDRIKAQVSSAAWIDNKITS